MAPEPAQISSIACGATIGDATATPIDSTNHAIKLLVQTDDGAKELPSHAPDCPLCVQVAAPPPPPQAALPVAHPLAHALRPIPAAHIAARTAAPLPPRGPPAFS